MKNIYYEPESFGLRLFGEIEASSGSYEFDKTVMWERIEDGLLLWARDSGCSCPTPFEDHDLSTLRPIRSRKEAWAAMRESADESTEYGGTKATAWLDLLTRILAHLDEGHRAEDQP